MKDSLQIDFARNVELAKKIFNLLVMELRKRKLLNIYDIQLNVDQADITINLKSDNLPGFKKIIKNILMDFFKNDTNLSSYEISEFENIIIVAKKIELEKLTRFLSCEICGYKTIYEEELFTHRYTHAGL
ncbi:MAG: hypothetical protein MRJ93_06110 [Nitrososphaeraceae archaeon]|nr:hypothetical protein [Nitrososphaeraceae archaeon]